MVFRLSSLEGTASAISLASLNLGKTQGKNVPGIFGVLTRVCKNSADEHAKQAQEELIPIMQRKIYWWLIGLFCCIQDRHSGRRLNV